MAKNMQSKGLSFKSQIVCRVNWALNSGTKGFSGASNAPILQGHMSNCGKLKICGTEVVSQPHFMKISQLVQRFKGIDTQRAWWCHSLSTEERGYKYKANKLLLEVPTYMLAL